MRPTDGSENNTGVMTLPGFVNESMNGSHFGSQKDIEFFDLYQSLVEAMGGSLAVAAFLNENPRTFKKRKCATDPDRILGATDHVFKVMDWELASGIEAPVHALVDYFNTRYDRAPSMSAERGEALELLAASSESARGALEKLGALGQEESTPKRMKKAG